jgi:hypothetical protein
MPALSHVTRAPETYYTCAALFAPPQRGSFPLPRPHAAALLATTLADVIAPTTDKAEMLLCTFG